MQVPQPPAAHAPSLRTHALRRGHLAPTRPCNLSLPRLAHLGSPKVPPPPSPLQMHANPALPHSWFPPGSSSAPVGCPAFPFVCPCVLGFLRMADGAMYLTSKAFKHGSRIPPQYTQEGQGAKSNLSPPLEWHNVPADTVCLALIMEDPEPQMENSPTSFTHWIVFNIPPTLKGLPENFSTKEHDDDNDELTQIREGVNDFKVPGYRGPNPPVGDHNYEFRLYALDAFPKVPKKPGRDRLVEAMEGHILAEAVLVGHYNKDQYGTENVKGYHPTGVSKFSGPGRAQLKSQHNNTRVTTVAHQ